VRALWGLALAAAIGCGDERSAPTPVTAPEPEPAASARPTAPEPPAEVERAAPAVIDLDTGGDEAAALRAVAAVPVWRGVLERHRMLGRRGDEGALVGVLASDGQDGRLLVDEAGGGALWSRVALPAGVELPDGTRVVAWGAFVADGDGWRFAVRRLARLAPPAAPIVPRQPSHEIGEEVAAPEDALSPSALAAAVQGGLRKKQREATLVFVVVEPPTRHGDGWLVADAPAGPPTAVVHLPGEQPIYGGLDYLAADERWSLRRGGRYGVTAAVTSRLRKVDGLPLFEALDAPVAISPAPR
jgi:hypothetical protein